jgi:hypothetical protein
MPKRVDRPLACARSRRFFRFFRVLNGRLRSSLEDQFWSSICEGQTDGFCIGLVEPKRVVAMFKHDVSFANVQIEVQKPKRIFGGIAFQ